MLYLSSFLEGPKAAMLASKDFDNGHYTTIPQHGIRAFGRVYSAWAYGQTVKTIILIILIDILTHLLFLFVLYSGSGSISTFMMDGGDFFFLFSVSPLIHANDRYPDLAAFLREEWEQGFLDEWDANDLITLLHTWQKGDVSKVRDGGDLNKCLSQIKAKGLIMPSKMDLYFPVSFIVVSKKNFW